MGCPDGTVSRRSFLRAAGAATAGALTTGCSSPLGSPTPRAGQKAQLVYQDWRTDWFPPMVQEMLEQFHESHPNIRVFFTPDPPNLEEKMLADMQAGIAPDVFQGCCTHFPAWAQNGYTLDLRPYVEADLDQETISDWDPAQYLALFACDGKQFGLPKYHGALALYYNKDLFDAHSLAYPEESWDHDDYLAAMLRFVTERDGDTPPEVWGSMIDVSWDCIQMHVNGWGGHLVDPDDPRHCLMSEPEALAAMEWLRARMWDEKAMATSTAVRNMGTHEAFSSGLLAMAEDGSWALKDILAGAKFRVGVAPFPAGPVRRVTLATTDGFGIYSGTKYPDAAWELLKFLISKDYGRAMARTNFLQPARGSLVEEWMGFVRQEFPEQTKDLDLTAFAHGQTHGYSVTAEIFANMASAAEIVMPTWQSIFNLGQAPVTEMEDVCRKIEEAQRDEGE